MALCSYKEPDQVNRPLVPVLILSALLEGLGGPTPHPLRLAHFGGWGTIRSCCLLIGYTKQMLRIRWLTLLLIIFMPVGLATCQTAPVDPPAQATALLAVAVTASPPPTGTASATATTFPSPPPSATPAPSSTPSGTATPTATAAATETPTVTATATATSTRLPEALPCPVEAPVRPEYNRYYLAGALWPTPDPAGATPHFWLDKPLPGGGRLLTNQWFPYGYDASRYLLHNGTDVAEDLGTPVLAAANGTIVVAGADGNEWWGWRCDWYGHLVVIQLDQTWLDQPVYLLYGHVLNINVEVGQWVSQGEQVAEIGLGGAATVPPPTHRGARRRQCLWQYPQPDALD